MGDPFKCFRCAKWFEDYDLLEWHSCKAKCDVWLGAPNAIGGLCLEPLITGLKVCQEHAEQLYWPQVAEQKEFIDAKSHWF